MKLNVGGTTRQIQMKTPANFTNALHSPLMKPHILEIVDPRDHTELLKLLNSISTTIMRCVCFT